MSLKRNIGRLLNSFVKKDKRLIAFFPHGGIHRDQYSIKNYTSDNSLALFHYIAEHYRNKFKYLIAIDDQDMSSMREMKNDLYPDVEIAFFAYYSSCNFESRLQRLKKRMYIWKNVYFKATYFFTSEFVLFPYKTSRQHTCYLGYYIPFKNDIIPGEEHVKEEKYAIAKASYDYGISTSLLSSQIIAHTYPISLLKFYSLGFSRNDELLRINMEKDMIVKCSLQEHVSYPIKKIFLYTPTHRDYEQDIHNDLRGVLGFNIDKNKVESLLRQYGAVIVCKIHSKQNKDVLSRSLPEGIILHEPNPEYGLCELMRYSDYLITDYTSAYFDYLLLDRPVLFNFYDFDKYKETRGFSFDPISAIIAGEVFTDETSFYEKIERVLQGADDFKTQRKFVCDLVHKYKDSDSSKRICDLIFNQE